MAKKEIGKPLFNTPYIVDQYITAGGMSSEVYIIHDINDVKTKLIAKVIYKKDDEETESFFETFRKESVTSLRLNNLPNLVHTNEFVYSDDKTEVALIQEFVEGTILNDFIEKKGFLTPRVALSIFKQILIGVQGLHKFGHQIIHCDLKPENVVISKDLSKATIIDFGISSVIKRSDDGNTLKMLTTNNGNGTEGYVSPDIFANKITVQYDFYSLGIILYKMIMKELPFKRIEGDENDLERVAKVVKKPLQYDMHNISANPTIPVSLENMIFRCIACKKEDLIYRYNDISEIIADTDRIIEQIDRKLPDEKLLKPVEDRNYETEDFISIDRLEKRNPWYQQWWFLILITALAVVAIVAGIIIFVTTKK